MFSYAGLGTELTHIPLTPVNSFSASHKSSKTNATPTHTDRVFGDTVSRVQPWDVLLWEPQGCGRVMGCYTPHRDTERYKVKKRKRIRFECRAKKNSTRAKREPENIPAASPSHPPLLFSLTFEDWLVYTGIVFTKLLKQSSKWQLICCLIKVLAPLFPSRCQKNFKWLDVTFERRLEPLRTQWQVMSKVSRYVNQQKSTSMMH